MKKRINFFHLHKLSEWWLLESSLVYHYDILQPTPFKIYSILCWQYTSQQSAKTTQLAFEAAVLLFKLAVRHYWPILQPFLPLLSHQWTILIILLIFFHTCGHTHKFSRFPNEILNKCLHISIRPINIPFLMEAVNHLPNLILFPIFIVLNVPPTIILISYQILIP